ncbi:MAG: STAS domain-containing protein [Chloroflexota bacterium]
MNPHLLSIRPTIEQRVTEAVSQQAFYNRGTLPPFRLPIAARMMVDGLLQSIDDNTVDSTQVGAQGKGLYDQGFGLSTLLASQSAAVLAFVEQVAEEIPLNSIRFTTLFFQALIGGFVQAEKDDIKLQQVEMERAYLHTVAEEQEQARQLRDVVRELSTPIVPIYEGILVLPLVGAIDDQRANEINEQLLEAIVQYQAEHVIIDITGVLVMDTNTTNLLLMTARAVSLLGSRVVLVGISPEVAQTVVSIGSNLHDMKTLSNLQAGLAYALSENGLSVQPIVDLELEQGA